MIDPQSGNGAAADELEKQSVGGIENLGQLHPNGRQVVDVEKAPVIDLLSRDLPECQPVGLRIQQFIKSIEAPRIADVSINRLDGFFDRPLDLRRFGAPPLEPPLNDLLFTSAFLDPFRIGFGSSWQVFQGRQDALEFGVEILVFKFGQILECQFENVAIGAWSDGEDVVEIGEGE